MIFCEKNLSKPILGWIWRDWAHCKFYPYRPKTLVHKRICR